MQVCAGRVCKCGVYMWCVGVVRRYGGRNKKIGLLFHVSKISSGSLLKNMIPYDRNRAT